MVSPVTPVVNFDTKLGLDAVDKAGKENLKTLGGLNSANTNTNKPKSLIDLTSDSIATKNRIQNFLNANPGKQVDDLNKISNTKNKTPDDNVKTNTKTNEVNTPKTAINPINKKENNAPEARAAEVARAAAEVARAAAEVARAAAKLENLKGRPLNERSNNNNNQVKPKEDPSKTNVGRPNEVKQKEGGPEGSSKTDNNKKVGGPNEVKQKEGEENKIGGEKKPLNVVVTPNVEQKLTTQDVNNTKGAVEKSASLAGEKPSVKTNSNPVKAPKKEPVTTEQETKGFVEEKPGSAAKNRNLSDVPPRDNAAKSNAEELKNQQTKSVEGSGASGT